MKEKHRSKKLHFVMATKGGLLGKGNKTIKVQYTENNVGSKQKPQAAS